MFILSHPTGNANVRAVLKALSDNKMLADFLTTISVADTDFALRFLPTGIRRQAARRGYAVSPKSILSRPHRELIRLIAGSRRGAAMLTRHEIGWASVDAVARDLDGFAANYLRRQMNKKAKKQASLRGVYCYEDCAIKTFQVAQEFGLLRLYDLPIGYWRAGQEIFKEESERQPEWKGTLSGLRDSSAKLARKDEEVALADQVFVATSYTKSTLALCPALKPGTPIHLAPYGAPQALSDVEFGAIMSKNKSVHQPRKLRVLFVGSLGQRKGIAYLLQAVELLKNQVDLTLIGNRPDTECRPLEQALRSHRWIPSLPHGEILSEMARHDVLVFPSLFEGFGLVILEAMSRGLPVITTPKQDVSSKGGC